MKNMKQTAATLSTSGMAANKAFKTIFSPGARLIILTEKRCTDSGAKTNYVRKRGAKGGPKREYERCPLDGDGYAD